jgi:hypothetical protein
VAGRGLNYRQHSKFLREENRERLKKYGIAAGGIAATGVAVAYGGGRIGHGLAEIGKGAGAGLGSGLDQALTGAGQGAGKGFEASLGGIGRGTGSGASAAGQGLAEGIKPLILPIIALVGLALVAKKVK